MARKSLEQIIRDMLVYVDEGGHSCQVVVLGHCRADRTIDQEVHHFKPGPGITLTDKDVAELFMGKARTFAQDLEGSQLFAVSGYYGSRQDALQRHYFRVDGVVNEGAGPTEGPTKEGAMSQAMRLVEAQGQLNFRQSAMLFAELNSGLSTFAGHAKAAIDGQFAYIGVIKDLALQMAGVNHQNKMAELSFQRETAERQMMMQYMPALMNEATGKEIFPNATGVAGGGSIIGFVAESMSEDTFKRMIADLEKHDPQKAALIAAAMAKHLEKKRLAKEAEQKQMTQMDPEREAMGLPARGQSSEAAE